MVLFNGVIAVGEEYHFTVAIPDPTIARFEIVGLDEAKNDCGFAWGAPGGVIWASITIELEFTDVQPAALVTVYVYVPGTNPEINFVVPEPVELNPSGKRVNV